MTKPRNGLIDKRTPSASHDDSILGKLGPGLITGAADDDPSGIAAFSQGGAQFGYALLWTLFFTYPLMVCVQVVSARIGRVSGYGLAGNIRRHYSPALLYGLIGLLLLFQKCARRSSPSGDVLFSGSTSPLQRDLLLTNRKYIPRRFAANPAVCLLLLA